MISGGRAHGGDRIGHCRSRNRHVKPGKADLKVAILTDTFAVGSQALDLGQRLRHDGVSDVRVAPSARDASSPRMLRRAHSIAQHMVATRIRGDISADGATATRAQIDAAQETRHRFRRLAI